MAKRVDPLKAKEKKQKIVAALLGVVLLAVLALQGPKLMKQLHHGTPSAAPPPASTSTDGTAPSLAAPTLSGSDGSAPSLAPVGSLASNATAPPTEDGQLTSFSRFSSKDPFAQQLSPGSTSTTSTSSSSSSGPSSGGSAGGGSTSGGGSYGGGGGSTSPSPGGAVISVNGVLMSVPVGTDFPQPSPTDPSAQPFFHLVSTTDTTAKISIAGGSYTNGAPTVTLHVGKPVTLMNTADGTRYTLVLKPQGTAVPTGSSGGSGSSTTPTTTTTSSSSSP